jgi:hypothetical protein
MATGSWWSPYSPRSEVVKGTNVTNIRKRKFRYRRVRSQDLMGRNMLWWINQNAFIPTKLKV